jgi:hypothetical protein
MLMKYFFVYKISMGTTIRTDYFAFATPSISILLLLFMFSVKARIPSNG